MQDTALNIQGSSPCPAPSDEPTDFPNTPFQNSSLALRKRSGEQKIMDLSRQDGDVTTEQAKENHCDHTKDQDSNTKESSNCDKQEDCIALSETKIDTCENKEFDNEDDNFRSEGSSDDTGSQKTNDEESEKRYVCPICDVVLFSPHDSTLHIRSHNNNITSPEHSQLSTIGKGFTCSICGKVLSSSSSLDRHVLVHSGERPFKCQICGFSFTTNGNMHRHMRTHPNASKTDNYESDTSSDSCGKVSTSPPPIVNCKKRKVSRTNTEFNNNIELSPRLVSHLKRKSPDLDDIKLKKMKSDLKQGLPSQIFNCPVCKRVNFATLNVLETHLEESHPEYKARCDVCNLIFKNYRVLNLHRFMVHFDDSDEMMSTESTVGFKDLTFVDFSSEKFPHIARLVCEQSLHRASSVYHKFQCEKCCRAFPCGSALNIHRQSCGTTNYASSGESNLESENEMPTDLSNSRRRKQSWPERNFSECSGEVEDERKREHFFAGLDLQNKSVPLSPVDDTPPRQQTFQSDHYFNTNMESKDLADIQSIISVTSAGGLIQDLSKSPQPTVIEVTPPDSGSRCGGTYDTSLPDEELQDCFAAEFRKMKLRGEFPCRLCDKKFPNLRALKGHNRVHLTNSTGGSNAPYRCNMCPHFSSDKSALIRHMRTHNGDRPYECGLCHYAFTTKANCERHLRNRHAKMTREEVKKSIIYHPSEDPTNDVEQKSSRDDVKRSLFTEKEQMKDKTSIDIQANIPIVGEPKAPKLETALRNYLVEPLYSTNSFTQIKTPTYKSESTQHEINQRRKSLDVGTMTFSEDESTEHFNNNIHPLLVPPKRFSFESPLDLSMDVLDLSKKKNKRIDDNEEKIDELIDDCEPQDLSKKSKMCDGSTMTSKQSSPVCFGTVQKPNLPSCLPIPFSQELNVLTPPSMKQSYENQTTPKYSPSAITIPKLELSSLYSGSPHLNPHQFYSHGFPSFPANTPLPPGPFPPYFIPPPPPPNIIFPRNVPHDFVEMKERLQKELIRGLQLTSGGSLVLDQLAMASAADRIQALHQQAMAEYSRHLESTKLETSSCSPTIKNESKSVPSPTESEKIQNIDQKKLQDKSVIMKPHLESSSVKMVIKNGILIPKQKQRRYRTERPFSCEHCSARFTLRSNMERHIKQQHPQYWTQRQRNSGNISIRRNAQKIPSSFVPPHGIFSQIDIGNKSRDHDNDDMDEDNEDMSRSSTPHDDIKSEIVQSMKGPTIEEKTFISDEVKYAIAQQLRSKLQPPDEKPDEKYNSDYNMDDEEVEENEELVIDEEVKGEEDEKEIKKELKNEDELQLSKTVVKEENVLDLASVSKLLDNASTQTFRQYFRSEEDNVGGEGSEEDEEGLVAGSASEGNNSGSDENKSDADLNATNNTNVPKKKSAYSLAPNRVSCPYCFRKFPWSSSLRRHVLTHTGQKPYKCSFCPLLFTTKSNCDRHLLRKHGGSAPVEKNPTQVQTETNVNQTPQNYTMRNVPERPYKCKFCPSSTFSTMSNLKKHIENKHQHSGKHDRSLDTTGYESQGSCSGEIDVDGEQPNQDVPENKDKKTLSDGRELHPGHSESIQCTKPTPTPLVVEQNYITPLNADLPFKCHLCDGSFSDRQEALEHIRENHSTEFQLLVSKGALEASGSNEENMCSEEGAGEESLEQLRGKFPDYANRKVMCAFCLRRFWSAEDLRRHMRTHTGERPFSCDICRRRFTLKHSMLRHRKKHSFTPAAHGEISPGSDDEVHNTSLPTTNHNNNTIPTLKQWPKSRNDEETDLISNLLGIQDKSIVDKMLLSKSADDAAKLLGVQK